MKTVLLALIALTTLSAQAASTEGKEIARKVKVLADMANGMDKHKVKGENAEEMILQLAMKTKHESRREAEEAFTRNLPIGKIDVSEMPGWGTVKLPGAMAMYAAKGVEEDENGRYKDDAKSVAVGKQILRELNDLGAKFGFTDNTSAGCGTNYAGLLVVDEESGVIYEITLTSGENEC